MLQQRELFEAPEKAQASLGRKHKSPRPNNTPLSGSATTPVRTGAVPGPGRTGTGRMVQVQAGEAGPLHAPSCLGLQHEHRVKLPWIFSSTNSAPTAVPAPP